MNPVTRSVIGRVYAAWKSVEPLIVYVLLATFIGMLSSVRVEAQSNRVESFTHYSTILGAYKGVNVILPVGYDPAKQYPTIYVLHGASGDHQDWLTRTGIRSYALQHQAILVFPDGNPFGWYLDSPVDPESRYESYIIKELIPYIDARYATIPNGSGRGIVGLSMGGHGALTLAFKHPDAFASASSLSGILDLTAHPFDWQLPDRLGDLASNHEVWKANSGLHLAGRLPSDTHLQILFDTGTGDLEALYDNRALHARLTVARIPHTYNEYPGSHDWDYWDAHIAEHLQFHMDAFARYAGLVPAN